MKSKLRKRLKKIETTLKELAIEIGLRDPAMRRSSKGPTAGDERKASIPRDASKAVEKTAQKARKKIKKLPE